jgi:hypothetical protein
MKAFVIKAFVVRRRSYRSWHIGGRRCSHASHHHLSTIVPLHNYPPFRCIYSKLVDICATNRQLFLKQEIEWGDLQCVKAAKPRPCVTPVEGLSRVSLLLAKPGDKRVKSGGAQPVK